MSTRTIHKLKNYLSEKDRGIADLKREFHLEVAGHQMQIAELKAELLSGVLKDHDSCQIYHDEEYTKLEVKYNALKAEIVKLCYQLQTCGNIVADIKEAE